jgi:hypothetical protein
MSDPIVDARLAAIEAKIGIQNHQLTDRDWLQMSEAPGDRDILVTVQEANGIAVRVCFYQPHGNREWRSITGQRIAPGCALAWMPLPAPFVTPHPTPKEGA